MIEITNLTKRYGAQTAVDNISFNVSRGEIVGFLGPNGAGKTTTMNILTGYISSTAGTAKIDGQDILENPREVKKNIGYLPEQPPLYPDMTVDEYLNFIFELKKPELDRKKHLGEVKSMVKIQNVSDRLIKNLSKGYRQRVGLAQALVGNPPVLILDEPTVGLDPNQILEIRNLIKTLGKKRTVILSTHILQEVSAVCERIIIINKGKIVAMGETDSLTHAAKSKSKYLLRAQGAQNTIEDVIKGVGGVTKAKSLGKREDAAFEFAVDAARDVRGALSGAIVNAGLQLLMLKPVDLSLEEVFLRITRGERVLGNDLPLPGEKGGNEE